MDLRINEGHGAVSFLVFNALALFVYTVSAAYVIIKHKFGLQKFSILVIILFETCFLARISEWIYFFSTGMIYHDPALTGQED